MSIATLVPGYFEQFVQPKLQGLLQRNQGEPFLLYYGPGIMDTGMALNRAFSYPDLGYRNMAAVKALWNPHIQEFLKFRLGMGADVSSLPEFAQSCAIGHRGMDIMYSGNRVTRLEFKEVCRDRDVIVNFDDITAPANIHWRIFPRNVSFRINPGKRRTGGSIIGDPYYSKYGITYDQILPAYKALLAIGNVENIGIHMMVCSNERHSRYFVDTVREILEVAALLYKKFGLKVKFVNIGGGFGIPYRPKDRALNLEWIGRRTKVLFERFGNQYGFIPKLMTECGRLPTGQHGFLVNPVISVEKKYQTFIGVPAAMTGCPRPAFYGAHHHMLVLAPDGSLRDGPCQYVHVVGPKCENWDRLTPVNEPRLLPKSTRVGDTLVTFNCGAHSVVMADKYNGRLGLAEYFDRDGSAGGVERIRRAERVEDFFHLVEPSDSFVMPSQNWKT